ncbi:transmembrane channel-like protein 3 isoform X1 [Sycon ciliatum]|uniref:transmembrane channel-like protein 3 isoform X1 n=1 Tax=Sycon ciliatum TaxID=27933 RepID=UPI0031F6715B
MQYPRRTPLLPASDGSNSTSPQRLSNASLLPGAIRDDEEQLHPTRVHPLLSEVSRGVQDTTFTYEPATGPVQQHQQLTMASSNSAAPAAAGEGQGLADGNARPTLLNRPRTSLRRSKVAGEQLRSEIMVQARKSVSHDVTDGKPAKGSTSSTGAAPESPLFIPSPKAIPTDNNVPLQRFPDPVPTKKKGVILTRWGRIKKWYERQQRSDLNPVFRQRIKNIESHYGSGYASFFTFLRFNLMLDLALVVLWFLLVIFPTALSFDYDGVSQSFHLQNLFDGTGYLGELWLFYGGYKSTTLGYHVDFFYLCMIYMTFFGTMLLVLRKIISALSSKGSLVHSEQSELFSSMILTSWDFSLATNRGVTQMQRALRNTLEDCLAEANRQKCMLIRTRKETYKLYARRCLMWTLTVIVMGGAIAAVYFTVKHDTENKIKGGSTSIVDTYGPSIVFSAINAIVPTILELLVVWSKYSSSKVDINVTIGKVFTLRIVNIGAFMAGLIVEVNKEDTTVGCGGTYIGQSLYRLVIIDTLSTAASRLLIDYLYFYWFNRRRELYVSQGVLNVLYRQALIWLGAMFAPVLPFMGAASLLLYFIVYYNIVMDTSSHPEKRYSQFNRDNTFYLGLMLLTLFFVGIPGSLVTTITFVNIGSSAFVNGTRLTATQCGPFDVLPATKAYSRLSLTLPTWLDEILETLDSVAVLVPVLFLLLIIIYYQLKRLAYERDRVKQINRQLDQEMRFSRQLLQTSSSTGAVLKNPSASE